ncbi:MAG TPA: hypothetical protein VN785_02145 [Candidatus Angelobacter sp.]|nr:hypothetical protein [Candidatus Angelobacter sp.]
MPMLPEEETQAIKNYVAGRAPNLGQRQRRGCLGNLFRVVLAGIIGGALLYGVVVVTAPWSLHIGERWTPLLTWHGYGQLLTKSGVQYPLYIFLYPSSHFSQLHRAGLRPTGGVQGSGWLCTASGATQRLELTGTIYGGWRSTEGSLIAFRLLEWRTFNNGQSRGFFDLTGRWQGPKLVMDQAGSGPEPFRSGVRIERASVALNWGTYSEFKQLCATAGARAFAK